jgi:hypothetical protein
MNMSRKRITAAAVAAMLSAMVPGIAIAAGNGDEHCNFNVKTGEQQCFATLDEAVANAEQSGKRSTAGVILAGTSNPVISGTFFDEPGYGGESLTVYSEAPCVDNGKVDYEFNLPDEWKNRISSVQAWANCWLWLYPQPNLGGDRDGPFKENIADIGDYMDNRTQSIGFS